MSFHHRLHFVTSISAIVSLWRYVLRAITFFSLQLMPYRKKYSAQGNELLGLGVCFSFGCAVALPRSPFHALFLTFVCFFQFQINHLHQISACALEIGRVAIASSNYHKNGCIYHLSSTLHNFRTRQVSATSKSTEESGITATALLSFS
jgi:hypothetical protein